MVAAKSTQNSIRLIVQDAVRLKKPLARKNAVNFK
jgi:hypothetical protein